jgi:hypothetical protein
MMVMMMFGLACAPAHAQSQAATEKWVVTRIAEHTNRFDNPHRVTAEQTGAATPAQVSNLVSLATGSVAVVESDPVFGAWLETYAPPAPDLAPYLRRDQDQTVPPLWTLSGTGWSLGGGWDGYPVFALGNTEFYPATVWAPGGQYLFENGYPESITRLQDMAAATNALVNAADAWFSVGTNGVLTLYRVKTNGITNAVWCSSSYQGGEGGGVDPAVTNELWSAIGALQTQLAAATAALAGKAPLAWGDRAPDGSANPDPDYMVFLNRPALMHASGFQWATCGAFSVLASTGTVAFLAADGDGELRIGPDVVSNYFGFVRGGSIVIGARAENFTVTNAATLEGEAYITVAYGGGDFPVLWFAPSLDVAFAEQIGAVWADNADGTATATAPATTARGFWYATTSSSAAAYFKSAMPALLSGGVFGSTNSAPVVYDSTITVTSGGNTYRIPAQSTE